MNTALNLSSESDHLLFNTPVTVSAGESVFFSGKWEGVGNNFDMFLDVYLGFGSDYIALRGINNKLNVRLNGVILVGAITVSDGDDFTVLYERTVTEHIFSVNGIEEFRFVDSGAMNPITGFGNGTAELRYTGLIKESGYYNSLGESVAIWSPDGSDTSDTGSQPKLVDVVGGNHAVGVGMPTDGSAWQTDGLPVDAPVVDEPNVGFDVMLLIGQSNMVGRNGPIDPVLDAPDARIFQYGSTRQVLEVASEPLDNRDENANDVGLGLSLAKHYADNYMAAGRKVLLVPAADGGTGFGSGFWRKGGAGYLNALERANEALALGDATSKIVLMAWHQGESDKLMTELEYASELDSLIANLREDVTTAVVDTPFLVGQIKSTSTQYGTGVAAALIDTPNRVDGTAFVTTEDLSFGGDSLHFTAAACRAMGVRYSQAYSSLVGAASLATTSVLSDYYPILPDVDYYFSARYSASIDSGDAEFNLFIEFNDGGKIYAIEAQKLNAPATLMQFNFTAPQSASAARVVMQLSGDGSANCRMGECQMYKGII